MHAGGRGCRGGRRRFDMIGDLDCREAKTQAIDIIWSHCSYALIWNEELAGTIAAEFRGVECELAERPALFC